MGLIRDLLAQDHRRLERLLARADDDRRAYERFRAGLVHHIGMEEKIPLPAARHVNGGEPIAEAERLRIDHGRLASLLVRIPSARQLDEIRAILAPHDRLEDGPDGVYEHCEQMIGAEDVGHVLHALRDLPVICLGPPALQRRHG